MSFCTPVFPKAPAIQHPSSTDPSLPSAHDVHRVALFENLQDQHLAIGNLPSLLAPPSPSLQTSTEDVEKLIGQIQRAVTAAQGHPSNGRWAHVHALTKLGCTDGCWEGSGRRVVADIEEDFEYFLAETEQQFEQWRARQEERRREKHRNREDGVQRQLEEQRARLPDPMIQAKVHAKVSKWQADIIPPSQASDAHSLSGSRPKPKAPSIPLGFAVSKLDSAITAKGKGKEKAGTHITSHFFIQHEEVSTPDPEPIIQPVTKSSIHLPKPTDISPDTPTALPTNEPHGARISQVSEVRFFVSLSKEPVSIFHQIFLPPSFPPNLATSTPPLVKNQGTKTKPPAIPLAPPVFSALPNSPVPFAFSQATEPAGTSSLLPRKRTRELSPPPDDSFELEQIYATANLPNRPQSNKHLTRAATPPRTSTPPLSQSASTASSPPGLALGNANNLFPRTPGRGDSISIQVLATSRHSQPRPRPPSRKHSLAGSARDDTDQAVQRTPPRASSIKTFFSSPASGSSSGSRDAGVSLMPPVSPLFAQTSRKLGQQQTSAQQPKSGTNALGELAYNSQFDVESRVERLEEMLEHDIDFDQWLRRSPIPGDKHGS